MATPKLRSFELVPRADGIYSIPVVGDILSILVKTGSNTKPVISYTQSEGGVLTILDNLGPAADSLVVKMLSSSTEASVVSYVDRAHYNFIPGANNDFTLTSVINNAGLKGDKLTYYVVTSSTYYVVNPAVNEAPFTAKFTPTVDEHYYTYFARLTNDKDQVLATSLPGYVQVMDQGDVISAPFDYNKRLTNVIPSLPLKFSGDVAFNSDGTMEIFDSADRKCSITWALDSSDRNENFELSTFVYQMPKNVTVDFDITYNNGSREQLHAGLYKYFGYTNTNYPGPGSITLDINFMPAGVTDTSKKGSIKMSMPKMRYTMPSYGWPANPTAVGLQSTLASPRGLVPVVTGFMSSAVDADASTKIYSDESVFMNGVNLNLITELFISDSAYDFSALTPVTTWTANTAGNRITFSIPASLAGTNVSNKVFYYKCSNFDGYATVPFTALIRTRLDSVTAGPVKAGDLVTITGVGFDTTDSSYVQLPNSFAYYNQAPNFRGTHTGTSHSFVMPFGPGGILACSSNPEGISFDVERKAPPALAPYNEQYSVFKNTRVYMQSLLGSANVVSMTGNGVNVTMTYVDDYTFSFLISAGAAFGDYNAVFTLADSSTVAMTFNVIAVPVVVTTSSISAYYSDFTLNGSGMDTVYAVSYFIGTDEYFMTIKSATPTTLNIHQNNGGFNTGSKSFRFYYNKMQYMLNKTISVIG